MRTESTQTTPPAAAAHGQAGSAPGRPAMNERRADAVQRGEHVCAAQAAARAAAEERARRVTDLKAQVKAGTYPVDTVEIAKALLNAV